jgi:hypothetical protein
VGRSRANVLVGFPLGWVLSIFLAASTAIVFILRPGYTRYSAALRDTD